MLTRAGSALAVACLFGAILSSTAAIAVAASDSTDAGIEQVDPTADTQPTTTEPTTTEPPTTQPPATEPPTTEPPTTAPPTTQPSTTQPTAPPTGLVGAAVQPTTTVTFEVRKDFSDDNAADVNVSLVCEDGTVANTDPTASESDPANFTVSGVSNDQKRCTATESPVPSGYTASDGGTCSAKLSAPTCTITNTKTTTTTTGSITVTKKLHPGSLSSSQSFSFTLSGTGGGTTSLTNGQSHTWSDLDTSITYSLSEAVPGGWQVKSVHCAPSSGVTEGNPATIDLSKQDSAHPTVECTFTNEEATPTTASFVARKDFSDNSTASVPVSVSCTSGTVSGGSGSMSESTPLTATVSGFTSTAGTTCTATETVPPGYTGSGSPAGTCSATLAAGGCTITNTLASGSFVVRKDFTDNNAASVPVGVSCTSGTVSGGSGSMSESTPLTVTVSGFTSTAGTTCTATETVPGGYTGSGSPAGTCSATLAVGICTITNTPTAGSFTARKDFSDDSTASVPVSVSCTSGTVAGSPTTMTESTPATVTVSGYSSPAETTCTATETVPSGYTGSGTPAGTCSETLAVGSCTITNTANASGSISVTKKIKQGSDTSKTFHFELSGPGGGTVDLGDDGTYTWSGLSTSSPYTLTEDLPPGWEVKVNCSPASDVSGNNPATIDLGKQDNAHPSVSCTFTNEEAEPPSAPFTASKDFSDDSESSVPVSLSCTDGSVTGTPSTMAEGSPASFTVSGFTSDTGTTCTATETVPAGYTGSGTPAGTCSAKLSDGGCEIVNYLNSRNFTVSKDFSDDSEATVPVSVSCTSGTVSGTPTTMAEGSPASVTVKGFTSAGTTTCTATETVPSGYTASGSPAGTCRATLSAAGCTITNTLNTASFVVRKDFTDDSKAAVPVSVSCGAATVAGSPTNMTESAPATVTVSHFDSAASTTCTATETVPSGYTADGSPAGTCSATLEVGVCTITNTLKTASFTIGKVFSDDSTTSVPIEVSCTSGSVPGSPTSVAGGSTTAVTVEGFSDPATTTCTATETSVPSGYTAQNGGKCSASLADGSCTITNDLNTTTFTVKKVFSDANPASVPVSLSCTSGKVTEASLDASTDTPAEFTVTGFDDAEPGSCTATETTVPDGYTPQNGGKCSAPLGGEDGGVCTITNDLNTASFTVRKAFSDHNEASVPVSVTCTTSSDKTVGGGNFSVSEASPAHVDASGFSSEADTTCTATETTIPDGYSASGDPAGTCSATLAEGSCTITNTLNTASFSVAKDFTDDNPTTVAMHLTCTSGKVVEGSLDASEGSPADFTVEGFSTGGESPVSCDATEDAIPGYTGSDGGSCTATLLGDGGGCTITNTPDVVPPPTATFAVLKDFSDNSPTRVTVRVSCTPPATASPGATTMAEGSPALIGVSGFDTPGGTTCTATETVPSGYTGSGSPAGTCSATVAVGSCTITNTVNTATFTVSKSFSDGNPASVSVNVACTSGTVTGGSTTMSQGSPATVTVRKFANAASTTCTASETPVAGYTGSGSPAGTCSAPLSAGSCSITNTLNPVAPPPPPGAPPTTPTTPGGPVVTPVVVTPTPGVSVGGRVAVRGTTSSLRRVLVAGEVVRVRGRAPAGCNPVLRVDDTLIGPVRVERNGSFDIEVGTSDLDPGRHVAVVECTNPSAPLVTKAFWVAAPLSSSNILLVALSSMTMLFGLGWVGIQTLAGTGLSGASSGAVVKRP